MVMGVAIFNKLVGKASLRRKYLSKDLKKLRESTRKIVEGQVYQAERVEQAERF